MEHLKPVDLKEVAKRFTERYYPQWLSRVDRIWEMLEKVDQISLSSESTKPLNLQGNTFGITGEIEPKFQECISGIAVFAFTCNGLKSDDEIAEPDLQSRITTTSLNLKISPGLQSKLEAVLSEMLPSMIEESVAKTTNKKPIKQEPSKRQTKEFMVCLARSSGFGTDSFLVNEEELHSKYLSNKKEYDLVVYQHNVEIKSVVVKDGVEEIEFEPIELYSNILNLLILFLKFKDEALPFFELYHCAWIDSFEHITDDSKSDEMIDSLKHAVSSLRNKMKVRVNGFTIPNAKRSNGTYTCKGHFKFCLVLKDSTYQKYTLQVN